MSFEIGDTVCLTGRIVAGASEILGRPGIMVETLKGKQRYAILSDELELLYHAPGAPPPVHPGCPPGCPPSPDRDATVEATQIDLLVRAKTMEKEIEALGKQSADVKATLDSIVALGRPDGGLRAMLHRIREDIPKLRINKLEVDYAAMEQKLEQCETEARHRDTRMKLLDDEVNKGAYSQMHARFETTASLLSGLKANVEMMHKTIQELAKKIDGMDVQVRKLEDDTSRRVKVKPVKKSRKK